MNTLSLASGKLRELDEWASARSYGQLKLQELEMKNLKLQEELYEALAPKNSNNSRAGSRPKNGLDFQRMFHNTLGMLYILLYYVCRAQSG